MTQQTHPPIVVMGVSGSGKSTIGELIAGHLGVPFVDGDDLHPAANKEKMRQGHPLDDEDRWPWLELIGERMAEKRPGAGPIVLASSALKRAYRDVIRSHVPDVVFVHLTGDPEVIRARMNARSHEYMPTSLLDSQLATLEVPAADEAHVDVDLSHTPEQILAVVEGYLAAD